MTLRERFTKQSMQWVHAQCFVSFHRSEALTLPRSCPLKVSQCVEPSWAGAQVLARGTHTEPVNACQLCHSSSSEVIRAVWFCLLGGCKQNGRHGPSLPCLLVIFCSVFLLYFYFYCGNLHFLVRQNHREFRNGNYIYPLFTAVHTGVLGDFHTDV